jgi:hypothetical protein
VSQSNPRGHDLYKLESALYMMKLSCKSELFWLCGSDKKIFKWPHPIFVIISPLKRTWPLIFIILNSLYLMMICTEFDCNWPACSGEDFKFSVNFYFFAIIFPVVLHLYNSESPLPNDDLCRVWLKLAQWFWRRSRKCKSLQTDRRRPIRKAHLSFQIRCAKNTTKTQLFYICIHVLWTIPPDKCKRIYSNLQFWLYSIHVFKFIKNHFYLTNSNCQHIHCQLLIHF